MALPNNNITTNIVKTALGVTSTDVGTLCKNSKVNPWSKWKPIKCTEDTLTDDILKANNFGIEIIEANTPAQLKTNIASNLNSGYKYHKPTSIYRLGDFRNYEHSAQVPVLQYFNDGDTLDIGNVDSDYSIQLVTEETLSTDYTLKVSDLYTYWDVESQTYKTMNRGLYLTDGTTSVWSTTTIPLGKTAWQNFKGKEGVFAVEFMTNIPANTDSSAYIPANTDIFKALPFPSHTVNFTANTPANSRDVWVEGTFSFNFDYSAVNYSFRFTSLGDEYAGGTLSNVYIYFSKDYSNTEVYSYAKLADSISLASEDTTTMYRGSLSNKLQSDGTYSSLGYIHIFWNAQKQFSRVPLSNFITEEL